MLEFEDLYESMLKCRKNVMWKDSVASYYLNGIERTINLEKSLADGTYKAYPPKLFTVYAPKVREVASIRFRDRVYQRCLNDNIIYPVMTHSFIKDNWACQKGKGTDGARNRLSDFMHRYYRKYGSDGYILKIDIKGYYPNMRHDMVETMFKAKLPDEAYRCTERILHEQYKGDIGYNPGSQLIQIAGISVLDKIDHIIKERLRIKYYLRYMDDFVIIHSDKKYLERCLEEIKRELGKIGFQAHPDKTVIVTLRHGIRFLGFDFRLTETGKVIRVLDPTNVRRERKKLVRAVHKAKRGELTRDKVDEMYASWKNHASKGNSYKMLSKMDKFYKNLWEENYDYGKGQQVEPDNQRAF